MEENIVSMEAEDTLHGRFMTFTLVNELYGIEIRYVMEIIGLQKITEMPEMPPHIKGIINLRGRIIPVMDVRSRFGKSARDYDDRNCIIVVVFNGASCGLIVDSVSEVMTIRDEDISARPNVGSDTNGFIKNIGKSEGTVILLVNCGKLLSDDYIGTYKP